MDTRVDQSISPSRVMLILALLLVVWLVFQFLPRKKPGLEPIRAVAESKLHAVGLADNQDWEGLPELFAGWADQIPWINDRSCFAYWHPGANTYAYFFEVTRGKEGVRFHAVPSRQSVTVPVDASEGFLDFDDDELDRYDLEHRADSPTHPFVFPGRFIVPQPLPFVLRPPPDYPSVNGDRPSMAKPDRLSIPLPPVDLPKQPNAGTKQ